MATQKEIGKYIGITDRQVRSLQARDILPKPATLDEALSAYLHYLRVRAGRIGEAREGVALQASRAAREHYEAELLRLRYEKQAGKLVSVDEVKILAFNTARKVRDGLMAIPDRIAPILVGMKDRRDIHKLLLSEIEAVCDELLWVS